MKKALFLMMTVLVSFNLAAQDTMMKSDKSGQDGSMMKSDSMMVTDADKKMAVDAMDSSAYNIKGLSKQMVAFTTEKDAQALAQKQTVVYFFAATWCPDCMATYKDLKAHAAEVPSNLTIVFVNYDKAGDLKKKYGITMQHTFVKIGPAGEKKKVWSGSTTLADLVKTAASAM